MAVRTLQQTLKRIAGLPGQGAEDVANGVSRRLYLWQMHEDDLDEPLLRALAEKQIYPGLVMQAGPLTTALQRVRAAETRYVLHDNPFNEIVPSSWQDETGLTQLNGFATVGAEQAARGVSRYTVCDGVAVNYEWLSQGANVETHQWQLRQIYKTRLGGGVPVGFYTAHQAGSAFVPNPAVSDWRAPEMYWVLFPNTQASILAALSGPAGKPIVPFVAIGGGYNGTPDVGGPFQQDLGAHTAVALDLWKQTGQKLRDADVRQALHYGHTQPVSGPSAAFGSRTSRYFYFDPYDTDYDARVWPALHEFLRGWRGW